MTDFPTKSELLATLEPTGQQHLLHYWDELSDLQRATLGGQIQGVDFQLIQSLFHGEVDQPDWHELSRRAEPPPAVRLAERESGQAGSLGISSAEAQRRGIEALEAGEVGVILTAGGQGSRLGFDLPKSLYPIGPVSEASLLQIHVEKVRALARRHKVSIPLYLMTSPATHEDTVKFVLENDRFGLAADELTVFCQGTMPAVDIDSGKLLLAEKDSLFLSPNGHGGTVTALHDTGALDDMKSRGVNTLFYFQVDNPLAPVCDAQFLGYHLLAESELTSLAIAKETPGEKVGNFAMIDGRLHVIEYSDLPDDVAEKRDDQGELQFWAGSIAIHVFDRNLFERAQSISSTLPYHIAKKKVAHLPPGGDRVEPSAPNALKFERFIFDLLPEAKNPIVVEFAEEECFAPLKNAPGAPKDTEEYVQQMMCAQHRRWLEAAGASVADGAEVEISPLYALDAAGVAERVEAGQSFDASQYLSD